MKLSVQAVMEMIKAVKDTPGVYDVTNHDFRIAERREDCWQGIADTLQLDIKEAKQRWRVIRDRYVKEQRLVDLGVITEDEIKFPYFKLMGYLDPFIKRRTYNGKHWRSKRKQNLEENPEENCEAKPKKPRSFTLPRIKDVKMTDLNLSDNIDFDETADTSYHIDENDDFIDDQPLAENSNFVKNFKSIKQDTFIEDSNNSYPSNLNANLEQVFLEPLNDQIESARTSSKKHLGEDNEDELFGRSIAKSLSKLSRLNNCKAKSEIYQVLYKLIDEEESEKEKKNV